MKFKKIPSSIFTITIGDPKNSKLSSGFAKKLPIYVTFPFVTENDLYSRYELTSFKGTMLPTRTNFPVNFIFDLWQFGI